MLTNLMRRQLIFKTFNNWTLQNVFKFLLRNIHKYAYFLLKSQVKYLFTENIASIYLSIYLSIFLYAYICLCKIYQMYISMYICISSLVKSFTFFLSYTTL